MREQFEDLETAITELRRGEILAMHLKYKINEAERTKVTLAEVQSGIEMHESYIDDLIAGKKAEKPEPFNP